MFRHVYCRKIPQDLFLDFPIITIDNIRIPMDLLKAVQLKLFVWQAPENVDFPAMINILIVHSQVRRMGSGSGHSDPNRFCFSART